MVDAYSLESLSELFGGAPVYVEVKVKSYGKPNKDLLKGFMKSGQKFNLNRDLFISSFSSNESSNYEDTRYGTELRFVEGIHKKDM